MKLMKRSIFAIFAMLALFALTACQNPIVPGTSGSTTPVGPPASASFAGAKGVYTSNGTTARTMFGRSVVSSSSADLGAVQTDGTTSTVTFTDANGNSVTATVDQAMQLNPTYLLLTLSWTDSTGTAQTGTFTGNLSTGALASVNQVPDNWPMVWTSSTTMYYESGGGIWKADLATGTTTELSTGGAVWNGSTKSSPQPWASSTWVYADGSGNVYAIFAANSQAIQAVAIAGTSTYDFGDSSAAWTFWQDLPGTSFTFRYWALVDTSTNALYVLAGDDVWDNNPLAVGGSALTGYALKSFPVTFNPATTGVISIATTPTAYAMINGGGVRSTHIGADSTIQRSILTNGTDTFSVSVSGGSVTVTHWDTSGAPVSNTFPDGSSAGSGGVTNWYYSGGDVYAGPTSSSAGINKVGLPAGGGTATDPPIVTPSGAITAWSVVGGDVFWTDSSGTWKYDIASAKKSAYAPPIPVAVTQ